MSEPARPAGDPASDTSRLSLARFLTAGAFVGLIAVVLGLLWKLNHAAPAVQNENVELKQQLANMQEMLADLRTAENLRREAEQVRRSDQQRAVALADEASRAVDALRDAVGAWQRSASELLTTDKGKPIAANADALQQFRALYARERPEAGLPEALRARLETLRAPLAKAIAASDASYAPSEDLVGRIEAVKAEASRAAEVFVSHNRTLAAIAAAAPASPTAGDTPDLQTALRQLEEQLAAEEARVVSAAVEKERSDRVEKLAAAKAETERQVTAAELQAEETRRGIMLRETADREAAAKAEAAEQERTRALALQEAELERKFNAALPEIQRLLRPFITDGYTQIIKGSYQKTLTKGPVSFASLQGAGHLEPTIEGVTQLRQAMFVGGVNDRQMGSFPDYDTREWQRGAARAQELLIQFGPLMVKKKMLAP